MQYAGLIKGGMKIVAPRMRKNMPRRGTGETFFYMPISNAWKMDSTLKKTKMRVNGGIPAHAINSEDVLLSKE